MLGALVVMLLGLLFVLAGIITWRRTRRLAGVPGTIVDVERHFTGRTNAYFPVVSFQTLDGAEVRATVQSGKVFHRPEVGRPVRVLYEPAKPAVTHIDSFGVRHSGLVFTLAGLGFLVWGVVGLVLG